MQILRGDEDECEFNNMLFALQCSNLMLIESVPGEPLSFHVIPFDNPRLQSTLQVRSHKS